MCYHLGVVWHPSEAGNADTSKVAEQLFLICEGFTGILLEPRLSNPVWQPSIVPLAGCPNAAARDAG